MRYTALLFVGLGTVAVAHSVACGTDAKKQEPVTAPDDGSSEIIGGVDAKSAALDAVGAIVYRNPTTGKQDLICTATLISPRVILTARHCAIQEVVTPLDGGIEQVEERRFLDSLQMSFAIGSDISGPKRLVPLESVETCNADPNAPLGFTGLACDAAIYRLKEDVTNITPIAVAQESIGESDLGKRMVAIGYGNQLATGVQSGTRKLGSLTTRAVTGAPLKTLFPTAEAFLAKIREQEGDTFAISNDIAYRGLYERTILDGYEAFFGGEGDAQACHGDSGGPILAKVDGKLIVKGVASTVVAGARVTCSIGVTYTTFGPKVQELLTAALNDPCEGIPAEGKCEGDVAIRCTNANEGARRVTRTDCSDALQRCIAGTSASTSDGGVVGDGGAPIAAAVVSCGD